MYFKILSWSLVLLTPTHLIAKTTFSSTLCVAYIYLSFDVLVWFFVCLFSPYSDIQEPNESLPHSKTSAAAQLDELMAHLCEMQAKVSTVPVIKPLGLQYLFGTQLCIPPWGTLLSCHLFFQTKFNSINELNLVLCIIWTQKILWSKHWSQGA